ncbi:MAG: CinA family nicotinamide mononucleotide deamidase-related protein [Sphingobacteriales bacterium]|nr:MAG: CinA family nicotinamide mononucleotide deamidase-related protein [Sphingobacteriales bacterium]
MANTRASIITIGDELLIGQTIDTNSAFIAQCVNSIGIDVLRRVAVGDDADAIKNSLTEEMSNADIVFITGGLGPTADDITKPLLCEYFGGKLVVNDQVLAHVKQIFSTRNRPFLERNMKQAEVPDVCTVLNNKMGTAPGMMFKKEGKIIISMPGVPFEMASIMTDEVMPYLKANITSDALVHRSVITAGEGESFIAERIKDLEEALPAHIRLAYLPGAGVVKLRLTGRGSDEAQLVIELEHWQAALAERLQNIVIATEDIPLEELIGLSLMKKNATLGLAESCTGGMVGHYLTQVPGSSKYFKGSIICYQNEIKEHLLGVPKATIDDYGVISEQTAIAMAEQARKVMNADYSFSVTGLLSASDEEERVPVGTVWMAVSSAEKIFSKEFRFHYDRHRNKEMALQMGMLLIWKMINDKL